MQAEEENVKNAIDIQRLVLVETLEVLLPMIYTLVYLVAYYEPNATLLNNLNPAWNDVIRGETASIETVISTGLLIFSVDLSSAVIVGILLWWFCKINFFKEFCKMLKEYWMLVAVNCGALIAKVSNRMLYTSIHPNLMLIKFLFCYLITLQLFLFLSKLVVQ